MRSRVHHDVGVPGQVHRNLAIANLNVGVAPVQSFLAIHACLLARGPGEDYSWPITTPTSPVMTTSSGVRSNTSFRISPEPTHADQIFLRQNAIIGRIHA